MVYTSTYFNISSLIFIVQLEEKWPVNAMLMPYHIVILYVDHVICCSPFIKPVLSQPTRTRGSTLQPAGVWIRPVRPWPPQSDENKKARPDRCLGSGRQGGWADGRLRKRTLSIWGAGSMLLMLFFLTCQVGTSRFYQSSFLSSFLPSSPTANSRSQWALPDLNHERQIRENVRIECQQQCQSISHDEC
jgi:hypothetical protein